MQDETLCTIPHTCRKPVRLQIFSSPCVETICLLDSPSPSGGPTTPPGTLLQLLNFRCIGSLTYGPNRGLAHMSVTQLDLQLSQCSSVHILRRCAIARYKYCTSHDIRKNAHVHRYLLPSLSRRPPWHRPSQALGAPRCIARTVMCHRSVPRRH